MTTGDRLVERARLDARNTFGISATAPMLVEVADAAARKLKAVVVVHVPPSGWLNTAAFESVIVKAGCVRAATLPTGPGPGRCGTKAARSLRKACSAPRSRCTWAPARSSR